MNVQKHILVADDDPELLKVLELRLTRIGMTVSTASNGVSALAKFLKTTPDLFIVDIDMPGADGLKVCERIVSKGYQHVPIIVHTGRSDAETIGLCKLLGVHHVLKGLDSWETIYPTVSKLLETTTPTEASNEFSQGPIGKQPSPKALIVDDDPDITNAIGLRLKALHFDTIGAASGVQGYKMALKHHPDIIITDYTMPEGGADYMIMRLQQGSTTSQIPVIVLTGKTFGGQSDLALRRELLGRGGVAAFLPKPLDFELLLEEMRRFIALPDQSRQATPARRFGM